MNRFRLVDVGLLTKRDHEQIAKPRRQRKKPALFPAPAFSFRISDVGSALEEDAADHSTDILHVGLMSMTGVIIIMIIMIIIMIIMVAMVVMVVMVGAATVTV